jgi:hypothetical protein
MMSQGGTGASLAGGAAAAPSVAGSAGEGAICADVEPCGGKLEGSWKVAGSCLEVTGVADLASLGLGCSIVPVQGTLFVTGNFSVDAQGAVVDRTITAGNVRFSLPHPCLEVSGTIVECSRVAPVFQAPRDAPAAHGWSSRKNTGWTPLLGHSRAIVPPP